MEAVQTTVLVSPNWDNYVLDSPYELRSLVASAFARYPYPESFFATRQGGDRSTMVFFTRADRPAQWLHVPSLPNRFPVTIQTDTAMAQLVGDRIARDSTLGRRFSVFEIQIGGELYQVVARLLYRDQLRQYLSGVFGFTVDMGWVRQHYFPELTKQFAKVGSVRDAFGLLVVDDRGRLVASSVQNGSDTTAARRSFRLMFFDPTLVALDPPSELRSAGEWAVGVEDLSSPPLNVAVQSASRTLIVASVSAVALTLGLVLSARASRAHAKLTELRSDFVSTVTHELKTPLASIRAAADTLVSGRFMGADAPRDYAELIVQESKRLSRLVDNLLAYARITDVTEAYSFEPLDPKTMIDEALKRFDSALSSKNFAVRIDLLEPMPPLLADRIALELLFDNLIDNAIRYSGDNREIIMSARPNGSAIILEVTDRGVGIGADELQNVTRRFYRGKGAASGGSGLGLAIANRIATDHGGCLTITSAPGEGTTVQVKLSQVHRA
jgi:signal transduction histidine kinase